jgi:type I restriction enzyme M protein
VALKKSDLYSSLWKSCDELRGGMDASQYKDYILTLLFVKYVSDKAAADPNSLIDVPEGGSFDDLVTFKGDKEIGDKVNKAIAKLAEANDLQKVIDLADFNDEEKVGKGKEMQDRLTNLIAIFQDLDFRGSRAEGDDLLGDAYEYLMRHFATESGKSKGQFYTPAEVSRVMAKLLQIPASAPHSTTVYDPTCGSGSLLLKVADESPHGLTIYGQEKDNATWALARMNMILHDNEIADIRKGDTITSPQFTSNDKLDTFDFLVANPPFSTKAWSTGLEKDYGRFELGMPPVKNGDYAFLLHMLKSLKSDGKGAVILPHGVLFRGNAEGQIRTEIVRRGYIKGIIGLPVNLFYGTGIPACIIVLDKENAQARTGIFMIDASNGFAKDGAKNRLRPRDMHRIVDAFTKQLEIPGYSRMVPLSEIGNEANDFNLNIPRYIDSSEPEDIQDLYAHLHGGIPNRDLDALAPYWEAFPSLRNHLFRPLRDGYSELAVDSREVQSTMVDSLEFRAFTAETASLVAAWWAGHRGELEAINPETRPAELIERLSESLLAVFSLGALIDEYAVYEQLMSYWHITMHDDVALIMSEGWEGAAKPRKTIEDKGRKINEIPDLVVGSGRSAAKYKMDLVPPALIIARDFATEQDALDKLTVTADAAAQAIEEFVEENSGDEGLLADAMVHNRITKALASARLKEIKRDGDPEEIAALTQLVDLYATDAAAKKQAKEAGAGLDAEVLAHYGKLSVAAIQTLVIEEKWGATVARGIDGELTALIQQLTNRITTLGERYDETLGTLEANVTELTGKVLQHLAMMGVS